MADNKIADPTPTDLDTTKRMLKQITDLWIQQVELCRKSKEEKFGKAARNVMEYVGKRYDRLNVQYIINGVPHSGQDAPMYLTVMNYTQAFVDILTPYVFAKNPNRLVLPIIPQLPPDLQNKLPDVEMQQSQIRDRDSLLCFLLQRFLSWTPKLYGLKHEGKMGVQESLGKGMSCFWVQMADGPTGKIPATYSDTIDNLLIDSDCIQRRDASFIIKICFAPNYAIAQEWGEDLEKLRGCGKSALMEASQMVARNDHPDRGFQSDRDVGMYYEVWSRIGLGQDLVGAGSEMKKDSPVGIAMREMGVEVHFAVMPGLDHPLGMDADKIAILKPDEATQTLKAMLEWPIKTWGNLEDPWPVTILEYKPNIHDPWAKPPLEVALPLQEFIDCLYQGLMKHADVAGRIFIVTAADAEQVVQDVIHQGKHLEMIKLNGNVDNKSLDQLVGFLKFPEKNKDIFTILSLCDRAFRELTGLDPSIFGGIPSAQDRSAEATKSRTAGISRRPDDYADAVEEAFGVIAAKEAVAARMLVDGPTVAPLFREKVQDQMGQPVQDEASYQQGQLFYGHMTQFWKELVHVDDPLLAAAECEYTVAAGSGRRRNKQLQQDSAQQIYTMTGQQMYAIAEGTGNFEPFIALLKLVGNAYENTEMDTIIEKIREWQQQQQMMMRQQGQNPTQPLQPGQAKGQPGQPGQPAQGGGEGPPNAPGNTPQMAGGKPLASRWERAAGGPMPLHLPPPPGNM